MRRDLPLHVDRVKVGGQLDVPDSHLVPARHRRLGHHLGRELDTSRSVNNHECPGPRELTLTPPSNVRVVGVPLFGYYLLPTFGAREGLPF